MSIVCIVLVGLVLDFLPGGLAVGPIVHTEYGTLEGKTLELNTGVKIDRWHSVPFAKPPTGSLRWKAPEDPESWNGTRQANRLPNACPQSAHSILLTHATWYRYDEDCLYMNIYSPNDRSGGPYPVMLYIHGGGYSIGTNIQYPGHFVAAKGVVVAVTNYRLGALGFVSTNDNAAPGNYGLLDQIKALKFVNDNIRAFGGDPKRITLAGQSAGAASVGILTLSPLTDGMFQQAITQSGSEQAIWAISHPDSNPHLYTQQLAEQVNCTSDNSAAMMDCLRDVSVKDIKNVDVQCTPGYTCMDFAPVVDGPGGVLPEDPWTMRKKGNFKKIPLLSGTTKDDGSFFTRILIPEALNGGFNHSQFEYYLEKNIISTFSPLFNGTLKDVMQAASFYYSAWPYINDLEANRKQFGVVLTDLWFAMTADIQLKSQSQYSSTYAYIFGIMSNEAWMVPEWMGVPHNAELPYVWGYPMLKDNRAIRWDCGMLIDIISWDDEDRAWADYMITMWTNFVKYGNPTGEPVHQPGTNTTTDWPPFTFDNMNHLVLERDIRLQKGYRQLNFSFWNDYMFKVSKMKWLKNKPQVSGSERPSSRPTLQKQLDSFFADLAAKTHKLTKIAQ